MIKFDWSMLFGFLGGIFAGVSIMFLAYLLFVLKTTKKNPKIVKSRVDITDEEMLLRIEKTKEAFKERKLKGSKAFDYAYSLTKELVIDTASDFFPNSKHPLLELSIDELLLLVNYINKRVEDVLDFKGVRIVRRIKVSTIINITEAKKNIEDNPIIKASKRYKIKTTWDATRKVINLVNPFWWAKKLVVSTSMNIIVNKICLVIIGIVGEETYKIYSKKVFLEDRDIDSGNEEILKEIEKEMGEEDEN